jgi:hypothetical protein
MIVDFFIKHGQLSSTIEIKDISEPKFVKELANR